MKLVVFEDNETAISQTRNWVEENRNSLSSNIEFDEALSKPINFETWNVRFHEVSTMAGEFLVVLDLRYMLGTERRNVKALYPSIEAEAEKDVDAFDGIALGEILIRDSRVTRTLVYIASTHDAAGQVADRLNGIAHKLNRSKDIHFSPTTKGRGLGGQNRERIAELLSEAVSLYQSTYSDRSQTKKKLLQKIDFGTGVAEDEVKRLREYFVQTDYWRQMFSGETDIIRGDKGTGKSAIYQLLLQRADELIDQGIRVFPVEQGIHLRKLSEGHIKTESEFRWLWKITLVSIIAVNLDAIGLKDSDLNRILMKLEDAQRAPSVHKAHAAVRFLKYFARSLAKFRIAVSPSSHAEGIPEFSIGPGEPIQPSWEEYFAFIDDDLETLNSILRERDRKVWIAFDRLDGIFLNNQELEAAALRALIRVYIDLKDIKYSQLTMKVFIRNDFWNQIMYGGEVFREATRVTGDTTLTWDSNSIRALIVRRLLANAELCDFYRVGKDDIFHNVQAQEEFFYRVFSEKVGHEDTFEWLKSRTEDSKGSLLPREVIALLRRAKDSQLLRFQNGQYEPADERLFDEFALQDSLAIVSRDRLEKTIYAEFNEYKEYIEALRNQKATNNLAALASIWAVDNEEAKKISEGLVKIGFFKSIGPKNNPQFWVPYLYQAHLKMTE